MSTLWPLDSTTHLESALREQGESEESIATLVPALRRLDEWKAPIPDQESSRQLLSVLTPLVPTRSYVREALLRTPRRQRASWTGLLNLALTQATVVQPYFWIIGALITSIGVLVMLTMEPSYRLIGLRALGPLLAVVAISTILRSARARTLEIELSCPLSPVHLILTRLVIVLGYDTGLGMLGGLLLWTRSGGVGLLALTLHWLSPLLLVTGMALLLSLFLPLHLATGLAYGGWIALLGIAAAEQGRGFLNNVLSGGEMAIGLAGILLLALAVARMRPAMPGLLQRS